jgi:hypothetical protein
VIRSENETLWQPRRAVFHARVTRPALLKLLVDPDFPSGAA